MHIPEISVFLTAFFGVETNVLADSIPKNVATAHVCRFYSSKCRNSSLLLRNLLYQVIFVNTITHYIDIKRRHRFSPPGLFLVSREVVN